VAGYRKDLGALQKELASFEETAQQHDREELLGRRGGDEVCPNYLLYVLSKDTFVGE